MLKFDLNTILFTLILVKLLMSFHTISRLQDYIRTAYVALFSYGYNFLVTVYTKPRLEGLYQTLLTSLAESFKVVALDL